VLSWLVLSTTRLPWVTVGERIQSSSVPEWFGILDSTAIGGARQLYTVQLAQDAETVRQGLRGIQPPELEALGSLG
jgi:hypothetical protein